MFAVIRTGGKQYRVAPNDVIKVERLPGAAGEVIELAEVLMLGDGDKVTVGAPADRRRLRRRLRHRPGPGRQGAGLQEEAPPQLPPQERPPPGPHDPPHHRDPDRRPEALEDGRSQAGAAPKAKKVSAKKKAAAAAEAKPKAAAKPKAKAAKPKAAKAKAKKE